MKKLSILAVILIISFIHASSQPCLPDGITFTTQAQIDNFQTNYPNCTEIEGGVVIDGVINNLNGLSVLTSIGGSLVIERTGMLYLTGLDNLVSVGEHMRLNNNFNLLSLTGLENLTTIGGSLTFQSCVDLKNLTGLNNLNSLGGLLNINHTHLETLSGLENLTSISGGIMINSNSALESLSGLGNVVSVYGAIQIWDNPVLTSLTALHNVNSIGYNLQIRNNQSLSSLSGLENIDAATIQDIDIYGNPSLSACDVQSVCDYLLSPNGIVNIYGNASGCNSHSEVANACGVAISCLPYGNYHFNSQDEIDNFQNNYSACVDLAGSVRISGSDVNNLDGLSAVSSIEGALKVESNPGLTSLSGLENLSSVGQSILIQSNIALESLSALENINSYYLSIAVQNNDVLSSLSGLENIDGNSMNSLNLTSNTSLSICDVQSVCDYLATQPLIWFVDINENAEGCNSQEEVEEACDAVSVNEMYSEDYLLLYPNPANQMLNISIDDSRKIGEVYIYNLTGQQVLEERFVNGTLDISRLKSGMYIIEVIIENHHLRQKLLVE